MKYVPRLWTDQCLVHFASSTEMLSPERCTRLTGDFGQRRDGPRSQAEKTSVANRGCSRGTKGQGGPVNLQRLRTRISRIKSKWQLSCLYSTDAVFCLNFCAISQQKLHPYHMRIIELCPKDLYSLFGSRLLRILTQTVSTHLLYSIQYSLLKTHINALHLAQFVCLTQGICSSVTNCWLW